ncbi:hypothetical protein HKCCE4037_13735 [Rhodobacterales bacterium HKCCE4037]|nr:hypothetical protein [Rhodobacterales bacterium HKCCE4037]
MLRIARFAVLAPVLALMACAAGDPLDEELPPMGDFRLAHNIVVAENMQQVPPSRNATPEEWEEILVAEIDRRFGGYEGDRLYHIGIAVDGYSLAPPGIPIILSPRSVLVLSVNIWDDALGRKLHDEPEQIIVFEGASPETLLVGSGIARNRNEQMQILARNAARRVQLFMLQNPEWFNITDAEAEEALSNVGALAEAAEEAAAVEQAVGEAENGAAASE